jgi:hypothetical protein
MEIDFNIPLLTTPFDRFIIPVKMEFSSKEVDKI